MTVAAGRLSLGRTRRSVLAQDLGGHTLVDLALGTPVLEERQVRMRMHVDKPRRDHEPAGVDDLPRGGIRIDRTDLGDPVAANGHVAGEPGISGPVDDLPPRISKSNGWAGWAAASVVEPSATATIINHGRGLVDIFE